MKFIDCHAHVYAENALPYEEQSKNWHSNNVKRTINVFCLETDLKIASEVLKQEIKPELLHVAGVTPHGASKFNKECEDFLYKYAEKLVAIGETGLDYHYTLSPKEDQISSFVRHIEIAIELKKPIVLHLRDADKEAQQILEKYASQLKGVMLHCYTSGKELAMWGVSQGFYVSASGIVTFAKSQELQDLFKDIPLDKLLVETDSPYLAPPPFRGQKNQPGYVVKVYEFLAEMYNVTTEELSTIVWKNSCDLFGLDN